MHNQYDYRCFRIIITKPQPKFEVQINVNLVDNTLKLNESPEPQYYIEFFDNTILRTICEMDPFQN